MTEQLSKEKEFLGRIREHEGIIFKLVNAYAADAEEKRDLIQEILYQAWKGYAGFQGRSAFSTWLYRLCLNTIFTSRRKQQPVQYRDDWEEDTRETDEDPQLRMEAKMLHKAIRSFPDTDRALILLHLEGYDHASIAEMIGISEGAARVRLHRIKKQLINMLNQ